MPSLILAGASGRMGQHVLNLLPNYALKLVAALVSPNSAHLGQACGDLRYQSLAELELKAELWLDFSQASAIEAHLAYCLSHKIPMLIACTGLSLAQHEAIRAASSKLPILYAANTSLAVNLLLYLSQFLVQYLPHAEFAITEAHHRHKKDQPSGTALSIREALLGANPKLEAANIQIASLRLAELVGEHSLIAANADESFELKHKAYNRKIYAEGALRALSWLHKQASGLYKMQDVFGFKP